MLQASEICIRRDRIEELMRIRGLDATTLANRAGISYDYVYKILRGERPNVSAINLARIAQTCGTSMEYLMGIVDDPQLDKAVQETLYRFTDVKDEALWAWLESKNRELANLMRDIEHLPEDERQAILTHIDGQLKQIRRVVASSARWELELSGR